VHCTNPMTMQNMMTKPLLAQQNIARAAMDNVASTRRLPAVPRARLVQFALVAAAITLAGCASKPLPPHTPAPAPAPAPTATAPRPAVVPQAAPPVVSGLPAVRTWAEYRRRAAQMIMAANSGAVSSGKLQDPLYGIPVVQIQLNPDGTIRNLDFMRQSKVGPETNNLALQAIRRITSFGPVSNLPGPWQFNETFLYNDALKFQLRTIVEGL
jgi:hypothetical protein